MAASREPRQNAGNRMSRVLEEELEEDDFYKTTYGGFTEEAEDNDFDSEQEDSADEVDSDFDRSEDDEPISDEDSTDKPKRRKRGVSTKAYKEPVKKVKKPEVKTKAVDAKVDQKKKGDEENKEEVKPEKQVDVNADTPMRKSSRRSTATNSLMTRIRRKEREESDKKKREAAKKPLVGVRRLTQEELLAEAEKTEKKNLKSLENYQRLEASRKKTTTKKRTLDGPTIKHFSTVMPANVDVEGVDPPQLNGPETKTSRNFLIFSHDVTLRDVFHWKKVKPPPKPFCLVSKKPARFVDPLTKIPYHDLAAFRQIREAYTLALEDVKGKAAVK